MVHCVSFWSIYYSLLLDKMAELQMAELNFVTWNVKGMNNLIKRNKIMAHLRLLKAGVAFLQETHILNADVVKLKQCWVGQVFHSCFNVKSRGTAILIRKDIPFVTDNVIKDPNGRYVIVIGCLFGKQVILVNIYAPNFDDCNFFSRVFITGLFCQLITML